MRNIRFTIILYIRCIHAVPVYAAKELNSLIHVIHTRTSLLNFIRITVRMRNDPHGAVFPLIFDSLTPPSLLSGRNRLLLFLARDRYAARR